MRQLNARWFEQVSCSEVAVVTGIRLEGGLPITIDSGVLGGSYRGNRDRELILYFWVDVSMRQGDSYKFSTGAFRNKIKAILATMLSSVPVGIIVSGDWLPR